MTTQPNRLDVVDCLRGFAIVAIMLLHNLEHFDLYHKPAGQPAWLVALDQGIWDSMFFLFSGKAYAIFAMLFGVTFYIQMSNRDQRGEDFRPRFAWRLVLLLMFGLVNSFIYQGDILSFYAVLGFVLIPVARMGNKAVFTVALLCMLQPYEWINVVQALDNPAAKLPDPASWSYYAHIGAYLKGDALWPALVGNFTNGKMASVAWSWENGRFFQIISLFMLGMLAARKGLFHATLEATRFWKRTLVIAAICFVPLYWVKLNLPTLAPGDALRRPLETIFVSWSNVAFMLVLAPTFILLFHGLGARLLRVFAPLGKMSLTSYMVQSLIGSTLYYGYGFGLWESTGATVCLLIGIALAVLQGLFSAWWLRHHRQGPLEALWHRATWWGHRPPEPALAKAA